jgi:hypothetical protein
LYFYLFIYFVYKISYYFHSCLKYQDNINEQTATLFVAHNGLGSTKTTSTPGSNKTDLLTRGVISGSGGGVSNVLMVTTTMGVIHRIHSHTSHTGPLVALGPVFEECSSCLQQGLLDSSSSSNDTNHSTA